MSYFIAGCCLAAALLLMWKRKRLRRTQAVLMLYVGWVGLGGLAEVIRHRLWGWLGASSTGPVAKLIGQLAPGFIAMAVLFFFILEMDLDGLFHRLFKRARGKTVQHKDGTSSSVAVINRHKTSVLTPWIALFVPLAVAAIPFWSMLAHVWGQLTGGLPHV